MKRANLLFTLLATSCLLPKFDVVTSFEHEGAGGTEGISGSGGGGGKTTGGESASAGSSVEEAGDAGVGAGSGGDEATAGNGGSKAGAGGDGGGGGSSPLAQAYQYTGSWPNRPLAIEQQPGSLSYTKRLISNQFYAESCAIADYNQDGVPDISSGRRWYEGPEFTSVHVFRGGHDALPRTGASTEIDTGASDDYSDFAFDMDGDTFPDIINIANPDANAALNPTPAPAPQPSASAYWYKNPAGASDGMWQAHVMHEDVRLEQHGFMDVDGDGKPEFYGACRDCPPHNQTKGYYYQSDWSNPTSQWSYRAVTRTYTFPFAGTGWMHGQGFGDVDGDGQPDLLERAGVWLDVRATTPNTTLCPGAGCGWISATFYDGIAGDNRGGAHMYAADLDGDGDADVVSADWAHGYGLAWYEQTQAGVFTRRQFMGTSSAADIAKYGPVVFSQPHALEVADMDQDGAPDIITGKMRFAHPDGFGDPDIQGPPLLVVFKNRRNTPSAANGGSVTFEPIVIDQEMGVGRQLAVGHINTDGILDICVSTKVGLAVFLGN